MNHSNEQSRALITFRICDKRFALPISDVDCVLTLRRSLISQLPCDTSGRIRGIFSYKGVVTVIARIKGMETDADMNNSPELTAIILNDEGHRFAILVDEPEAVTLDDENPTLLDVHSLYTGERQ